MNKVILIGRLVEKPENRVTQNNISVASFRLACTNDFVDKDGKRTTEFISCIAFNKLAETICKFCDKGRLISIQGRVKNSSYEGQDGNKKYRTDVVVEQLEFLGSGSKEENQENNIEPTQQSYSMNMDEVTITADMLPF